MNRTIAVALAAALSVAATGIADAAQKPHATVATYHGKDAADAGRALLDIALQQAGKGSWERIGVGRAYYLGGYKAEGQAIFDALLNGKHEDSDVYRIARVYNEAGEWDRAKSLFDRYFASNSDDAKGLAEVGAYYLLHGDRARAEQMFDRAFEADPNEVWVTVGAADAYLGVTPEE
jgi:tetratricopeptide (TPR) repeat protein